MATKTAKKDIIERFDDFFKEYRIEQLDNGRLRLVIDSTKAAMFVENKIGEGVSAKDAVEWLLEFFIVKPNTNAATIAERRGTQQLIAVVEDVAPDSKQAAVEERATVLASDPEPVPKPTADELDEQDQDEADELHGDDVEETAGLNDEPKPAKPKPM